MLKLFANLIKKYSFFLLIILIIAYVDLNKKAFALSPFLSFSYGKGDPDHLTAYRVTFQSFWPLGVSHLPINLTGYWDLSLTNLENVPPKANQHHSITIVAASPVMRLQTREKYFLSGQPYLEFGIGASLLSNNHLGHRNLGGQFAFQDLIGLGLFWKTTPNWSLSYHYLHYSNAGLLPPNQGIDVKHLISIACQFS